MNKVIASVLGIGFAAAMMGCPGGMGGIGGECKFNKGEMIQAEGNAKAFLASAMDLKKTVDSLEADWKVEITAMAGELKVDPASGEDGVLAKLDANVKEIKVQGECNVNFKADMDAGASGSAAGSGAADSSSGSSGSGSAAGNAHADVHVDFSFDCKAQAKVDAQIKLTTATVTTHFPKLLGITIAWKDVGVKAAALAQQGSSVVGEVATNLAVANEVKCAGGFVGDLKAKADVKVSFQASASASAQGNGGASAKS